MKALHPNTPLAEKGNSTAIILGVVAVLAVGILAYLAYTMKTDGSAVIAQGGNVIEPGNPIVATVNGDEIYRTDVVEYMNTLPIQVRQMPLEQLFPAAINELVNDKLARQNAKNAKLSNMSEIKARLKEIEEEMIAAAYLQDKVETQITEDKVKVAYTQYVNNFPELEEVRASHILVAEEADAKAIIRELKAGADFAELAKEKSKDSSTAANGGDINYFVKADVVPEFAEAAFSQEVGEVSAKPIKTQFGYHIIKVADKRIRQPAKYEEAKPALEAQLRQAALRDIVTAWRTDAEIAIYDINGKTIEPASGDETETSEPEIPDAPTAE